VKLSVKLTYNFPDRRFNLFFLLLSFSPILFLFVLHSVLQRFHQQSLATFLVNLHQLRYVFLLFHFTLRVFFLLFFLLCFLFWCIFCNVDKVYSFFLHNSLLKSIVFLKKIFFIVVLA